MWWWATVRKFGRCSSALLQRRRPPRLGQYWQKTLVDVQQIIEHRPAIMPFLTTFTITLSCLPSAAPHTDSWWFGHVEPDDVVIADIGGQALDIFLHGPESAHKNGILKTFTHTSIPIHPCALITQTKSKTLNSRNMWPSFCSTLPVQCGGGRLSGSLAYAPQECSTSEAFWPRTVLTDFFCRCVQQILQHRLATMPFLITSTITLSCLASAALFSFFFFSFSFFFFFFFFSSSFFGSCVRFLVGFLGELVFFAGGAGGGGGG